MYFLKNYKFNETLNEALKYLIVGAVCTIFDTLILFLVTNYLGINYLISSVASFSIGSVLNYFLCVRWVFNFRRLKNRKNELALYILIHIFVLLVNTITIWFLTSILGIFYIISKFIAILVTFIINFVLKKNILHREFL